jgi:hypothetical protein
MRASTILGVCLLAAAQLLVGGCAGHTGATRGPGQIADQRPDALQPRRVGPAAMEAWIAPWESGAGDLYPETTVYISVAPERWEYAPAGGPTVLRPIQQEARTDEASAKEAPPSPSLAPDPRAAPTGADAPRLVIPDGTRRET